MAGRRKPPLVLWLGLLSLLTTTRRAAASSSSPSPSSPRRTAPFAPKEPGELGVVVYPLRGKKRHLVSTFLPPTHYGVDIPADEGEDVLAMTDGAVTFGHDAMGGNVAILKRADGSALYYAHLSAFAGDPRDVSAGDVIGRAGHTGNAATTAPHVHLEVWPSGSYQAGAELDPTDMLATSKVLP